MLTWQNSASEFNAELPQMAILPLACYEPHGPHLPVGTDVIIINEVARRVALQMKISTFLLPTWPFGTSVPHAGQAGAVYLGYETLWAVVRDVVISLHQHGIHRVAVLNNHGSAMTSTSLPMGNFIVKTAVRQLNYETPGLTAILVQPFAAARESLIRLFPSAQQEVHAGAVETAILMYLAPNLVGNLPPDHVPDLSEAFLNYVPLRTLAPGGIWGRPGEASAEKGAEALDAVVRATTDYMQHTFAQLAEIKNSAGEP